MTHGVPRRLRDAVDSGDYDEALAWLTDNAWPGAGNAEFDRCVVVVADVLRSVDPASAAGLLRRLLDRRSEVDERIHLLQRLMDAAARAGLAADVDRALTQILIDIEQTSSAQRVAVLNNVGTFLKDAGQFDAAQTVLRQGLAEAGVAPSPDRVTLLINLAVCSADRSFRGPTSLPEHASAALDLLREAESNAQSLGLVRSMGNIWFNRGHIFGQLGDYAQADDAYICAESFFNNAGADPVDLAYVARAKAAGAAKIGRYEQAAAAYEQAKNHFLDAGELDEAARSTIGLVMALAMGGTAPTGVQLDRLLSTIEVSRPRDVPDLLMNLGNIASHSGHAEDALTHFREASRLYRQQGQAFDRIRAAHATAVALRMAGRARAALRLITVVRHRYVAAGQQIKVAEVDHNLALILRDLGVASAELDAALRAVSGLDRHRHALTSAGDREQLMTRVYPHAFDLALDAAVRLDRNDVVAGLAERARVQTAPRARQFDQGWQLEAPRPIISHPTARPIEGDGDPIELSTVSDLVGGSGAGWLGWVRHRDRLLRVLIRGTTVSVTSTAWPVELLADLTDAYASTTQTDIELAAGDLAAASRRALYRAASGPLLDDVGLADRLRKTLPISARTPWTGRVVDSQQALLSALASALLPAEVEQHNGRLLLAPPPELGRIPWAALPVSNGLNDASPLLVEHCDIALVPPVGTLSAPSTTQVLAASRLWLADPRNNLPFCRQVPSSGWKVLGGADRPSATRDAVLAAFAEGCAVLVVRGHVRPGTRQDPTTTALLLHGADEVSARDLLTAKINGPRAVIALGCDAAGAGTAAEWSGLPVGFGRVGADRVVVTQWPVIDDPVQESLDIALADAIDRHGAAQGLWTWQREQAAQWRDDPVVAAPYRWACPVIVATSRALVDDHP